MGRFQVGIASKDGQGNLSELFRQSRGFAAIQKIEAQKQAVLKRGKLKLNKINVIDNLDEEEPEIVTGVNSTMR